MGELAERGSLRAGGEPAKLRKRVRSTAVPCVATVELDRLSLLPAREAASSLDRSNCVYSPFEGDYTTIKIVKETSTVIESHMGQ